MFVKKIKARRLYLGSICAVLCLSHGIGEAKTTPLQLQEVLDMALQRNLAIQIERHTKQETRLAHRIENARKWFPKVDLSFAYVSPVWKSSKLEGAPTLSLSYDLANLILDTRRRNKSNDIASLDERIKVGAQLKMVVDAYYELAVAQKKQEIMRNNLHMATNELKEAAEKWKSGLTTRIDYLEVLLHMKATKQELLEQQGQVDEKQKKLNAYLGNLPDEKITVESNISIQPFWNIFPITKDKVVDLDTEVKLKKLAIAKIDLMESIFSVFSCEIALRSPRRWYSYDFSKRQKSFDDTNAQLSLALNINLASLFLLPETVRAKRSAIDKAALEATQTKLTRDQPETLQLAYSNALDRYKLLQEELKIRKQKFLLEQEAYHLKQKTLLELQKEGKKVGEVEIKLTDQALVVKKAEFALYQLAGKLYV